MSQVGELINFGKFTPYISPNEEAGPEDLQPERVAVFRILQPAGEDITVTSANGDISISRSQIKRITVDSYNYPELSQEEGAYLEGIIKITGLNFIDPAL